MKVVKVLNNSLVLALDDSGQQVILVGKGIGFHREIGSRILQTDVEKVFVLKDRNLSRNIIRLAADTDAVFFEISRDLIERGRNVYHLHLMDNLYLSLTDHLSYAVKRVKEGVHFQNFYSSEIRKFNPNEFEIGSYALDLVEKRTGIRLPEDEAGNIAMHFINAQQDTSANHQKQIIQESVSDILNIIKYTFRITEFNTESTGYTRCVTHMRLFVQRILNHEMLPDERDDILYHQIVDHCQSELRCVQRIDTYVAVKFNVHMTTQEEMFLVLHIHRMFDTSL
ncbi:MAG: PRD domain-containing protein [Eubacterium sp.]